MVLPYLVLLVPRLIESSHSLLFLRPKYGAAYPKAKELMKVPACFRNAYVSLELVQEQSGLDFDKDFFERVLLRSDRSGV